MIAGPISLLCVAPGVCPGQALDAGGGVGGSVAAQAATSVLDAIGSALSDSSAWLVGHVMGLIESSTGPQLYSGWFGGEMALMGRVIVLVVLPVLMAATIGPVLRQDGRRLFRVWGVGLPLALVAGLAGSQAAGWGLAATDALCAEVLGSHAQHFGHQFSAAIAAPAAGDPLFVGVILSLLTLVGAVLLWLELVVRSAGVYVATFFMPLALVGYIWPATAGVARRAVEILVSLILAKFVIVASLSLGAAALGGGGVDAAVSGGAILLIAAFAPFVLLRLAPVVEASAIAHLEGLSRRPGRAAERAATSAASAPTHPVTSLVMSGAAARWAAAATGEGASGGSASDEPAGRAVVAQPVPMRAPDYRFPSGSDHDGEGGSGG